MAALARSRGPATTHIREGKPALALIEYDIKGMPPRMAELDDCGRRLLAALLSALLD